MRLCRDGASEAILLDDALPCTADGVLAFARGARRQLWVSLIEKAFAKMYGCYEALEGGTTDEALAALTGFPCERISLQPPANNRSGGGGGGGVGGAAVASWGAEGEAFDLDMLWARLLSFDEAGFLCTASIDQRGGFGGAAAAEAMGLLTQHAYSLLQAPVT